MKIQRIFKLASLLLVATLAKADATPQTKALSQALSKVPPKVPATVLHVLPKGALSLQTKTFNLASGDVLLHLYTLPVGHSPETEYLGIEKRTGPVQREQITTGPSLLPSRFWLDVFARSGASWKRVNSVPFIENKDANDIKMRWLYPAKKQGPVVLMHFGYTHWHEWVLLVFPQGFSGPYTVQEFYWGGEGETGVMQRLDKTDKAGRLMIEEEQTDEGRTKKYIYKWDGVEFAQPHLPYFAIGASVKTKAEAENWIGQHKQGYVRPSSHYKKLRPGYYIVLLNRFATLKEANAFAAGCRKEKIPCAVKRAF
jgi:hypothetical protein